MIIAPSVLSFDYTNFKDDLNILNEEVKWLHFDVMDGHFVPNLSFGPDILKQFRKNSSLFLDVHIMVDNPIMISEIFINAGADSITFHYEAFNDHLKCLDLIKKIKDKYIKAGISIKPNTDVRLLEPLLEYLDIILVMSVEPGFGGQSFIPSSLDKISYLKDMKEKNNYSYLIEVDGGINNKTAHEAINAGVDVLVAGSYIFKGDIKENIKSLIEAK